MLRRVNAVLTAAIFILFILHAVCGVFQLTGIFPGGNRALRYFAYLLMILVLLHAVIGVKLTVSSIVAAKKAGVFYPKENKRFLAVRISGFVILLLMGYHMAVFLGDGDSGTYFLNPFDGTALFLHLLLVLAIVVHVIANVKPFLISFGLKRVREYAPDIIIVLSVILAVAGAAFTVYYFRWMRL